MSKTTFSLTAAVPWIGLALGILSMCVVGLYDYSWTTWLVDHRWEGFARFMANSIFEGEPFGGGDPVLILLIFVLFAYIVAWLPNVSSRLKIWRPQLGFVLSSGLLCGMVMVHSLKMTIGRARPERVFDGRMPFSDWFEMGPYLLLDGSFNGSFPSGHTAQGFIPMTIVYCLIAWPGQTKRLRLTGYLCGAMALVYVLAMGVSRCMNVSHWLSDVLASIVLSWFFYHLFYFRLFKVPQQSAYWREHGAHAPLPSAWEMRLSGLLLCVVPGLMALVIGVRAIAQGRPVGFWMLVPCGALWAIWFAGVAKRYHARVSSVLSALPEID